MIVGEHASPTKGRVGADEELLLVAQRNYVPRYTKAEARIVTLNRQQRFDASVTVLEPISLPNSLIVRDHLPSWG